MKSTVKVSYWQYIICDCIIGQALAGILFVAMYLSGSGEASIIAGVVIHILLGCFTISLAKFTWILSKRV